MSNTNSTINLRVKSGAHEGKAVPAAYKKPAIIIVKLFCISYISGVSTERHEYASMMSV